MYNFIIKYSWDRVYTSLYYVFVSRKFVCAFPWKTVLFVKENFQQTQFNGKKLTGNIFSMAVTSQECRVGWGQTFERFHLISVTVTVGIHNRLR